MTIEFDNLKEVDERDGTIIYEVEEKPTYVKRIDMKQLLEEKQRYTEELVRIQERADNEIVRTNVQIADVDKLIQMIVDKEKEVVMEL